VRKFGLLGCVGALVLALVIAGAYFISVRNNLVGLDEQVNRDWAQVQSQYQRRFDLIPNLVRTVEGAANFEKSTLEAVTNARARVGSMTLPAGAAPADQNTLNQYAAAQQGLGGALGRLIAVAEAYPQLRANQNFLELQSQLEGTENRIAVARNDFNGTAQQFNTAIRRFPASVVAGMSGFKTRPYFQGQAGSETAPRVDFGK
jgi:LemA protein